MNEINSAIVSDPQHTLTRKRICLAASGGGHVRQLLDLREIWEELDIFFVTEPTALGHSIAANHPTDFVEHFAWGQSRLGHWRAMLGGAFANVRQSFAIVRRRRPDLVITTGAGSMAPLLLFARLFGARVILIDSFARFTAPSLFARLAGRFAHVRIAQSQQSAERWGNALLFDPFLLLPGPRPDKAPLLFATVGATLPFPRLVEYVAKAHADGALPPRVIVQNGLGEPPLPGIETHQSLDFDAVKTLLDTADIVVCHGGTGSIITALQRGCHVIVVPRKFALGEHYDDHQMEIAEAFAARGLIQIANDYAEFLTALRQTADRPAPMATTAPAALGQWLQDYIAAMSPSPQ